MPRPYSGGSIHSTLPVDEFWSVYADESGNNENYQAYNGGSLAFGGSANQSIDIGYLEPFWEINFNLTSGASGGWSYVLEYPTAVDSSGNPTSWATLTTLNDTTAGLTQSGQVTFNPPSNWVPASIAGSAQMYYVRVRTVTAETAPVANTIKGDNYTNSPAGSNGSSGVIPAYDWALDPQGGYLNPQQYAIAASAGYTARFGYQSRLFYDGSMRFYTNPANPQFKTWALGYFPSLVTGNPYNGLFVDNSGAAPPQENSNNIERYNLTATSDIPLALVETTGSYNTDYATLLNEIGQKMAPNGWIMANTVGSLYPTGESGQSDADAVIGKVQAYYEEGGLSALKQDTTAFDNLYNLVYYRANNDSPGYAVIDSRSLDGSSQSEEDGQTQLTTLAAYYVLAPTNPSQGALDFFGGEATRSDWVQPNTNPPAYNHWSPAAAYDVGTPSSALPKTPVVFNPSEGGTGTESDQSTYTVYERQFTGSNGQPVLVLYKPVSVLSSGAASQLTGSASATTVTLGGSYYVLQADGTLSSAAVTTISLENGEGAILVQAGGSAPAIASAAMVTSSRPTSPTAGISSTPSSSGASTTSQISGGSTAADLLASAGKVSMSLPADQSDLAADLDRIFSLWAVAKADLDRILSAWITAKMEAFFPGRNGPSSGFGPWLGSSGLSKTHHTSLPFDDSFWEATGRVADLLPRS